MVEPVAAAATAAELSRWAPHWAGEVAGLPRLGGAAGTWEAQLAQRWPERPASAQQAARAAEELSLPTAGAAEVAAAAGAMAPGLNPAAAPERVRLRAGDSAN